MRQLFRLTAAVLSVCTLILAIPFSVSAATESDFEYSLNEAGTEATVTAYNGTATDVVIPDTLGNVAVTAIGSAAFSANTTVQSVAFPDTLEFIGDNAFINCTSLTAVTIPDSVITIENMAFYGCTALADITLSPYTYDIGYQAFHNTAWFNSQNKGVVYIGRVAYSYAGQVPAGEIITIKYGTAAVAPYAFARRSNLAGVNLPVGLRNVGAFAFMNCTSLSYVRIPPSVTTIGDGILLNAETAVLRGTADSYAADYAAAKQYHLEHDATLDYLDGDMNKNGKVNSSDVRTLLRIITKTLTEYDIERYWSCDLKYDGVINTSDVRALLTKSLYS